MKTAKPAQKGYSSLLDSIGSILEAGRNQAYRAVNTILVKTYWEIGKSIVEFEQEGRIRAEYGSGLLDALSRDLIEKFGKGFSRDNLEKMRKFYHLFRNSETLSRKLSWSQYCLLLRIEDGLARSFYCIEAEKESWSVRELDRQINAMLFERIGLSKDKKELQEKLKSIMHLERKEQQK